MLLAKDPQQNLEPNMLTHGESTPLLSPPTPKTTPLEASIRQLSPVSNTRPAKSNLPTWATRERYRTTDTEKSNIEPTDEASPPLDLLSDHKAVIKLWEVIASLACRREYLEQTHLPLRGWNPDLDKAHDAYSDALRTVITREMDHLQNNGDPQLAQVTHLNLTAESPTKIRQPFVQVNIQGIKCFQNYTREEADDHSIIPVSIHLHGGFFCTTLSLSSPNHLNKFSEMQLDMKELPDGAAAQSATRIGSQPLLSSVSSNKSEVLLLAAKPIKPFAPSLPTVNAELESPTPGGIPPLGNSQLSTSAPAAPIGPVITRFTTLPAGSALELGVSPAGDNEHNDLVVLKVTNGDALNSTSNEFGQKLAADDAPSKPSDRNSSNHSEDPPPSANTPDLIAPTWRANAEPESAEDGIPSLGLFNSSSVESGTPVKTPPQDKSAGSLPTGDITHQPKAPLTKNLPCKWPPERMLPVHGNCGT
ncbi:hypothetical protein PCASD_19664 [Puccinia coronata f. sp. avenae]|uniref:Uncharacterized protein n=1 Tax=Puccinia coronata f. sp. avenae TaxID=200324 RepID=A0A2N5TLJ1_9BASI|nr:hypothetical protein PCASD_19664 [Puccinia coronata f. sp. avenae]